MNHTIYNMLAASVEKHPEAIAICFGDKHLTYRQCWEQVHLCAWRLMKDLNPEPGTKVALIAKNSISWLVSSFALQALGAVECPFEIEGDETSRQEFFRITGCQFCLADSAIAGQLSGRPLAGGQKLTVFSIEDIPQTISDQDFLHIQSLIEKRQRLLNHNSLAAVIRTSSTTGSAKLVMMSQHNFTHNMRHIPDRIGLMADDVCLCCLPLWHLFGRLVTYIVLCRGAHLEFCEIEELATALPRVKPMLFPGFPILWIKLYHDIWKQVEARSVLQVLFRFSLSISRRYYRYLDRFRGTELYFVRRQKWHALRSKLFSVPGLALLYLPFLFVDLLLFRRLRNKLGGRLRTAIIGDAPLPFAIDRDIRALGFPVLEGYGSSEQMISAIRSPSTNIVGSAGQFLPEIQMCICQDSGEPSPTGEIGEILVAGPQVCLGYLHQNNFANDCLTEIDGKPHYKTGDLGKLDNQGNLVVVGRKINRIPLKNGNFFYPELTENVLRGIRHVAQVMVFPTAETPMLAMIILEIDGIVHAFSSVARQLGIESHCLPDNESDLYAHLQANREAFSQLLSHRSVELFFRHKIRMTLKSANIGQGQWPTHFAFCPENLRRGKELTLTLKLRRDLIRKRYAQRLVPLQLCPEQAIQNR